VVSLPMHPYLDEATIGTVVAALAEAAAGLPDAR
jgi:dTDP-4-amino-4,6-dideoxygalactose transaminase